MSGLVTRLESVRRLIPTAGFESRPLRQQTSPKGAFVGEVERANCFARAGFERRRPFRSNATNSCAGARNVTESRPLRQSKAPVGAFCSSSTHQYRNSSTGADIWTYLSGKPLQSLEFEFSKTLRYCTATLKTTVPDCAALSWPIKVHCTFPPLPTIGCVVTLHALSAAGAACRTTQRQSS